MINERYSHYGWFFMCPVYIGNLDSAAPYVDARSTWLEWWHDVNLAIFSVCVMIMEGINPEYEAMFPLYLTGEIKRV
jgi:hypothetical protein